MVYGLVKSFIFISESKDLELLNQIIIYELPNLD
jgi:hypothetical protein